MLLKSKYKQHSYNSCHRLGVMGGWQVVAKRLPGCSEWLLTRVKKKSGLFKYLNNLIWEVVTVIATCLGKQHRRVHITFHRSHSQPWSANQRSVHIHRWEKHTVKQREIFKGREIQRERNRKTGDYEPETDSLSANPLNKAKGVHAFETAQKNNR